MAQRTPIFVLLLALLATMFLTAAEASMVGIRLTFTEQSEGVGCTKEEHNTVVSIMHDGVIDLMEQRDSSRMLNYNDDGMFNFDDGVGDSYVTDPSWCKSACKSFRPGTCYVAYPPCDDTRRHLEPRTVSDPAEFARLCIEEEDAVLATIKGGLEEVSDSCNALLQTEVEVMCSDLSKESPIFVPATSSSRPAQIAFLAVTAMVVLAAVV